MSTPTKTPPVTLLILGAGWTSTFLLPLCKTRDISHAATSTTGRPGTIKFQFEPKSDDLGPFKALPIAHAVLITFPLTGPGQSEQLLRLYAEAHPSAKVTRFIQLGSTGIFTIPDQPQWVTRHSSYNTTNARAVAEDELLGLGGCVLNLSGLWGGERQPRDWVSRVVKDKAGLGDKNSLHLIHGLDVARAILAVAQQGSKEEEQWKGKGERWMLTDLCVYDWWELVLGWADKGEEGTGDVRKEAQWVGELMREKDVRALPRSMEQLGRCYDSREFWQVFKLTPLKGRVF